MKKNNIDKDTEKQTRITFARPDINFNDPNLTEEQINAALKEVAGKMAEAILDGKQDPYWGEIHKKLKSK